MSEAVHGPEPVAAIVRMANQIAANFSYLDESQAGEQVAVHLRRFWTPAMRAELVKLVESDGEGLSATVRRACEALRAG